MLRIRPIFFALLVVSMSLRVIAQEATPLFEQPAYDVITLNEENKSAVIQVFPLDFADRKVPANPDLESDLIVKLLIKPEQQYKLKWKHIGSIRLFETAILAEVDALLRQQRYEEAFPYFRYLLAKHRNFPGVAETYETYLKRIVELAVAQKQHDQALARVFVWHEFNPQNAEASNYAVKVLEHYLSIQASPPTAEQTVQTAGWLIELEKRIPSATSPTLTARKEQFTKQAENLVKLAEQQIRDGRYDDAETTLARADLLRPDAAGAAAARASLRTGAQRITIDVSHGLAPRWSAANGAVDWRALRDARFLAYSPVEITGWADGLPTYESPGIGDPKSEAGVMLFPWTPPIAAKLKPLANAWRAEFEQGAPWPATLRVTGGNITDGLRIDASTGAIAVDGWLAAAHLPPTPNRKPTTGGATTWVENDGWYKANPAAFAPPKNADLRIRVVPSQDFETARKRLLADETQVLDRIAPWQVQALIADRDVEVESYAIPAVHLLILNPQSPAFLERTGRAAVIAAVQRDAFLEQFSRGAKIPGAEIPTGVWPGLNSAPARHPVGVHLPSSIATWRSCFGKPSKPYGRHPCRR
ncbi:MAG: ABC transporter substrate-binding protein [Pirellulales bacterium]